MAEKASVQIKRRLEDKAKFHDTCCKVFCELDASKCNCLKVEDVNRGLDRICKECEVKA